MNAVKYVLGMGDTEVLCDGIFATENDAHDEAEKLRGVPHDNGDFHSEYVIAKVIPSPILAKNAMDGLTKQTAEFFTMILGEVESFGNLDGDVAVINDAGLAKLEATLLDILDNDTEYPNNEAIAVSEVFKPKDDNIYTVGCSSCSTVKYVPLSLNQRRGFSEYATFTCDSCQKTITTRHNSESGEVLVEQARI